MRVGLEMHFDPALRRQQTALVIEGVQIVLRFLHQMRARMQVVEVIAQFFDQRGLCALVLDQHAGTAGRSVVILQQHKIDFRQRNVRL